MATPSFLRPTHTRSTRTGLATLGALAALAGCIDRPAAFDQALDILPPVSVAGSLVYIDRPAARALVLDLQAETPTTRRVPIGSDPVSTFGRLGPASTPRDEVLVLSRGLRGERGVAPEPGSLTAIPVRSTGGNARRYTLQSPFNAIAQTEDGRYGLAYFRPSTAAGRLLFNPNEIALLDLDAPPSETNPRPRTVRSFGGVPNNVVFSPPMMVNGRPRTLALVYSDAYVTLLDLDNPGRAEITVRLTLPEDPRAVLPAQAVFDTEEATVYLRASSSNDIYALRLEPSTPADATANDFRPSINQLAAGQLPSDMALIGDAGARRLLVVSPGSRDARVIDARANTTLTIPLEAAAQRILLFEGPSPRETTVRPRALLYSTTNNIPAVSFLELTDLEARRGQNVDTLQLGRAVTAAVPLTERGVVMLGHPGGSGSSAGQLSLLDLGRRTAAPILAEVSLNNARFDDDRQTLWVAPASGERLGFIDLQTFRPGEVRLDGAITDVIPLRGDAMGRSRVAAVHPSAAGWVTLLDARDPRRETARSTRGFLLTNILDTEAP